MIVKFLRQVKLKIVVHRFNSCAQVQYLCTGGPVDVALCAGLLAVAVYQGEISLVDLLSNLMTF